jgi:hypothetical protein
MKIFHAIEDAEMVPLFYEKTGIRPNILIAHNNIKGNASKLTADYRSLINLLYLDSGAYAVFTGASKTNARKYRQFIRNHGHLFDVVFNLDDRFDDPEHNLLNRQLYLEDELPPNVKAPIPVVHHKTDPFGEFESYVELGHEYIAIGSSGSREDKDKLLGLAKAKHPNVKVHLFGDLNRQLLEKHLPYSADSASWSHQAGRGGGVYYWRPSENKQYFYNVGGRDDMKGKPHIRQSPIWEEIRAFLYDKFRYEYRHLSQYKVRWLLNIYFYTQWEDYLNSLDK